jgi:NADH-quinone oxidoreductase subunit L
VAHACHTYDIFEMGGLAKKMKTTTWTFWVGTLALAGIVPFSGFWSKDEILAAAHQHHEALGFSPTILYYIAVLVAAMTAFYMGRCNLLTFHGKYRGKAHPHESPKAMAWPLVFLAICAIFIGFVGAPFGQMGEHGLFWHLRLLTPTAAETESAVYQWGVFAHPHFHWNIAILGTVMALGGFLLAGLVYGWKKIDAGKLKERFLPIWNLLWNKYYIDEFYLFLVRKVQQGIAVAANWLEQVVIIGGLVNGLAGGAREAGNRVRMLQTGRLHSYVSMVLLGLTLLVFLFVLLSSGGA